MYVGIMPTPWLSWPIRLARTRCSATRSASGAVLPPAFTIALVKRRRLSAVARTRFLPLGSTARVRRAPDARPRYTPRSVGERIRAQLEVDGDRLLALAALHQPRRPIAAGRPQPAPLPAGRRIVDAPVEPLGVEPERVRHAQHDHLAVLERDQAVVEVAR